MCSLKTLPVICNKFAIILFLDVFLFGINETYSQTIIDSLKTRNDYIVNTTIYNKGIYKTFIEFKYNNPSIIDNFIFYKKKLWLTDKNTGDTTKVKKREIWGFCDGEKIFVRRNKYDELIEIGRYCYFKESGVRMNFIFVGFFLIPMPLPYNDELIINYNTGKTSILSKSLLKKILTRGDPELLTEFKNQPNQKEKLYDYIVKYNKRNEAKIK